MQTSPAVRARALLVVLVGTIAFLVPALPAAAQQAPPAADPVPVTLDVATTAVLVQDITSQICTTANCQTLVPAIAALEARARAVGVYVVHSTPQGGTLLPEVTPAS